MAADDPCIEQVLAYWFGTAEAPVDRRKLWFGRDQATDDDIRARFGALIDLAARGECQGWAATARGALALVVLLDQFPRNIHRNTPGMFAQDGHALAVTRDALARGLDGELEWIERSMLLMPLMHAEDRDAQDDSVQRFAALRDACVADSAPPPVQAQLGQAADYAERHARIVRRFGRYPHRNAILGRDSSDEETAFLREPDSSF